MNKIFRICLAGLFFVWVNFLTVDANSGPYCSSALKPDPTWLEYRHGEFIVQYTLEGRHALGSPGLPRSGAPDVVKDVALQLAAMRDMLDSLGFRHPLQSERYRSQGATHILVRIQDLQRLNGRAFDEVRRLPSGECVLIVHVNSAHRSGNLTPAHEYFHLVQYGYTMFKRPWFLEGMARWAEDILGAREVSPVGFSELEPVPEKIFKHSYQAAPVWYGLIEYCDDGEALPTAVPHHLSALRYSTGTYVVEDRIVPGAAFIRRVLEALDVQDDRTSDREGLPRYHWPEKFQRAPSHDSDIWKAIAAVCPRELPR